MSRLSVAPRRALLISLRYLGDVLLATPLASTLKHLYPECVVDMLVFSGCEAILEGNPMVAQVLTTREGASVGERRAQMRSLWRHYDLAVITTTGTPPLLFGYAAAHHRVGFAAAERTSSAWKRMLLTQWSLFDPGAPRLELNDRLARLLGADAAGPIVPPTAGIAVETWSDRLGFDPRSEPFAVVHPSPRWRYKRWTDVGWRTLVEHLEQRLRRVLITGSADLAERRYLDGLGLGGPTVLRLDGRFRLAETADLLRLAALYVGPDTAVTHLAAACGTPTLALFGPTNPVIWGPASNHEDRRPYEPVAPIQYRGNVAVLQNADLPCVPCHLEGCERHRDSHSDCLDRLSPARVISATETLLQRQPDLPAAAPAAS
jgi:heptosyltransferase-3